MEGKDMYRVTEEKILIENEEKTVYGICCESVCIPDISTDREQVEHLAELCNREGLEAVHLRDVVSDFIG